MRYLLQDLCHFRGAISQENILSILRLYSLESDCSSRSVIDMKCYPRERGKKCIHYFGGGDYSKGAYYSRKYGMMIKKHLITKDTDRAIADSRKPMRKKITRFIDKAIHLCFFRDKQNRSQGAAHPAMPQRICCDTCSIRYFTLVAMIVPTRMSRVLHPLNFLATPHVTNQSNQQLSPCQHIWARFKN